MLIADQTVVIAGGGRGIGRALAERFGRDGARLALINVNAADLETTRAALESAGIQARVYEADVAVEDQVVAVMDRIGSDLGGVHVLIDNAGIIRDAVLVKVKDGEIVTRVRPTTAPPRRVLPP